MSQQSRYPPQLETYRNMLDSMVQFLQISSSLVKQKAQISLDCEPECALCTPQKKCDKCSTAEKVKFIKEKRCQVEEQCKVAAMSRAGSKPDAEELKDVSAVSAGSEAEASKINSTELEAGASKGASVESGTELKAEGTAQEVPKENGDKEPCVCDQVRTIKSAAGIGGDATQNCSKEVKRRCNCSAKSKSSQKCVCPTDDEKSSLHEALMMKLDNLQKQIDLVRVDIGNLSGKNKSAALYKEIMKGSTSRSTSRTINTQPSDRVVCVSRPPPRSPAAQYPDSQYLQMQGEQINAGPVRAIPLSGQQSTPKPRQMMQIKPPPVSPIRPDQYARRQMQRDANDSCVCSPEAHPLSTTPAQSSEWLNQRYEQCPVVSRTQGYTSQYNPYDSQNSGNPFAGYGNVQGSRFRPFNTNASPSTPSMQYRNVQGYQGEYECQDDSCDNDYCGN